MNPQCARCGKVVYPTEKVNCLDKYWHKGCFHCEVCKMALNMNNYKGYEKKPYCNAHYPKQSFTTVADTPENLRLKQQSELQSQSLHLKRVLTLATAIQGAKQSELVRQQNLEQLEKFETILETVNRHLNVVIIIKLLREGERTPDQLPSQLQHGSHDGH
nr:nebulette [Chelonoidis abingdonii]